MSLFRIYFPMYKSIRDMHNQEWVLCEVIDVSNNKAGRDDVKISADGYVSKYSYLSLLQYWIDIGRIKIYEDGDPIPSTKMQY